MKFAGRCVPFLTIALECNNQERRHSSRGGRGVGIGAHPLTIVSVFGLTDEHEGCRGMAVVMVLDGASRTLFSVGGIFRQKQIGRAHV